MNPNKDIFPKRLKSARLMASLSQDQLVLTLGGIVSKNAISKYERGEMLPNSKVLLALAKALSVKPDYFFRPFQVEITDIEFSKNKRVGVKKLNAIKHIVTDQLEKYLEVESILRISSNFVHPISELQIRTGEDVEKAVNELLEKWNLGFNALPNIIELLEEKELKIIEIASDTTIDGFSGWANREIPVIVLNKTLGIERKRFTALHELGHLLMKFDEGLGIHNIEKLCHRFAGAMLIPRSTFFSEFGKKRSHISIPELVSVKETYGISIQGLMERAKDLDVISLSQFSSFQKAFANNLEETGFGQYQGKERSDRFMQLVYRAVSEHIISISKGANLAGKKLACFREDFAPL